MKLSIFFPVFALVSILSSGSLPARADASCNVRDALVTHVEHKLERKGLKLDRIDGINLAEDGDYLVSFHFSGEVEFMGTTTKASNEASSVALHLDLKTCVAKGHFDK